MKKLKEQIIQLQVLSELSTELLGEDNTEALKPTIRKMSQIISSMDVSVLEKALQPTTPPAPAKPVAPAPVKPQANNPQQPKANSDDKSNETQVRPVQP